MKKVLLVLPLAIMLANCTTPRHSTSSASSGRNGSSESTSSTNMNTGTSNTKSTSGTAGSGSMKSSGSASMGATGTSPSGSTGSPSSNWNSNSVMQAPASMAGNGNKDYDPNNLMQNPEKYRRPFDLIKTGGWTYNTDWRRNTNFRPEVVGQWQLVPTEEVASNWMADTSHPDTYASYWTVEAVAARLQVKMDSAAALAMRDSAAWALTNQSMAKGEKSSSRMRKGTTGSGTTGSMGSGGSATMSHNSTASEKTGMKSGEVTSSATTSTSGSSMSGTASATTGAVTMSGNVNASGNMANNPAEMNNSQGAMNGTASSSSPSDIYTAVNGNKFLMPRLTLYPESGSVIAYTGCNNLLGTLTMDGNVLHFQDALPSTNMECIGGFDQSAFLDRLRRANSYDIVDNQLRLKEGEQVLMVLSKAGY